MLTNKKPETKSASGLLIKNILFLYYGPTS